MSLTHQSPELTKAFGEQPSAGVAMHELLAKMTQFGGVGTEQLARIQALTATIHDLHACDATGDAVRNLAHLKTDVEMAAIIQGRLDEHQIAEAGLLDNHALELQAAMLG